MKKSHPLIAAAVGDLRSSWKTLALTGIAYKLIAFIVLTPLVSLLFRGLLSASGRDLLADQDLLYFLLGPLGWFCLIAVGALWLAIEALEQAALIGIICAKAVDQPTSVVRALTFAGANALPVVRVTSRLIAMTLLVSAPFLAIAGIVYTGVLSEYDINYYLQQRPPEFLVSLGIGGVLALVLAATLLRLYTGWFFALPLVLFEDVPPRAVLRTSRERAQGHRPVILTWILVWLLVTTVISSLATAAVLGMGRFVVPRATGSLGLLVFAIGTSLLLWSAVNLILNLISTTTFASVLFNVYLQRGCDGHIDATRLSIPAPTGKWTGLRITRWRLLVAGVVGVAVASWVGATMMSGVRLTDKVQITAHRGASKAAPENTMAAVKRAIGDGADWVEVDVQETADGEVVVFHDSDFMKLSGTNLKLWDATMDDLKRLDVGSWFDPKFKDERVPTLGQVLDACKGKVGVNIELKYYGHDDKLEQRVAEIVEAHDMADSVILMSLKMDAVKKMKSIRPDWKVGLLMSVSAGNLARTEADFLAVNASFASRNFIWSVHEMGKEVHVWTVNDAPTMSVMVGRGVDSLITDKPALARTMLKQRADLTVTERLMLELAGIFGVVPQTGEQ